MTDPPAAAPTSESTAGPRLVVWGTNVVIQEMQEKFKRFLQEFIDENAQEMGDDFVPTEPLYIQKLEEVKLIMIVYPTYFINYSIQYYNPCFSR